ncbi:hypothetical protein KGF56_001922 [Candida oxycetoniae]|uniref:Uncharacterized protein n=1 Tax=Candida oxycetoniae TaxID=497107 RepID=A0AAI9WYP9_9ASCO|nr:uncharacterized protein KGF56_001922 [Candida oxycetoniae]KAI3405273.2 hypothetical protein KGF56_001922 [Candida oxycetoniae]
MTSEPSNGEDASMIEAGSGLQNVTSEPSKIEAGSGLENITSEPSNGGDASMIEAGSGLQNVTSEPSNGGDASKIEAGSGLEKHVSNSTGKHVSNGTGKQVSNSTGKQLIYKPTMIASLDCKILQYQYGMYKLEHLIAGLKKLQGCSTSELPLLHYIVLLTGNTFSINEKAFDLKFEQLSQFKTTQLGTINITATASHIPYDITDLQISALDHLPSTQNAKQCLKQLEALSHVCLQGYEKKLASAKLEKSTTFKGEKNENSYYNEIDRILKADIFHNDIDLTFSLQDATFPQTSEKELLENQNYQEATLIDMDIKALFVIVRQFETPLKQIRSTIDELKKPKDDPYALHKVFLITHRLNEIYTIIRRFGRKTYLSNHQHLFDSKFLFHHGNAANFKSVLLKNMDEYYNSMKKNGTLIANITRLIRQDSKFEINHKNILNYINFANQGLNICEKSLNILRDFGLSWIIAELKFRRIYHLPKQNLYVIYQSVPELKDQTQTSQSQSQHSQQHSQQPQDGQQPQAKQSVPAINGKTTSIERSLKKLDFSEGGRRSRSSSVSSITSNGSNSSTGLMRRASITSSTKPNLTNVQGRVSSPRSRPNSMMILQEGSKSNKTDTGESPNISALNSDSPVSPQNRKRWNIQHTTVKDTLAASGAAAAVNRSNNNTSIRSPLSKRQDATEQTKDTLDGHQPAKVKSKSSVTGTGTGMGPSRITKKLLAVDDEAKKDDAIGTNPKLSASQRFSQHVKHAAKSGTLMTQQRETLTSVTYDPNTSSRSPMRRCNELSRESNNGPISLSPPGEQLQTHAQTQAHTQPRNKTRDQVTKQNTHHNSHIPDNFVIPDDGSTSTTATTTSTVTSSSTDSTGYSSTVEEAQEAEAEAEKEEGGEGGETLKSSEIDDTITVSDAKIQPETTTTVILKRVRFTGVPDWTEAEDAPTKYSHALLRNFAYFRHPNKSSTKKSHYFSKSDQLLSEESLSFRANQGLKDGEKESMVAMSMAQGAAASIMPKPKNGLAARFKSKLL